MPVLADSTWGPGARSSRNTGPAEAALGSRAEVVVREGQGLGVPAHREALEAGAEEDGFI